MEIIDLINNADCYYEMSDDHRVWERGEKEVKTLKNEIEKLSLKERTDLAIKLNANGKLYWKRYLKNTSYAKI